MARFNEETPDDPNVRYFSYGAYFEPSWSNAFRIPWGVVYEREGEQCASSSSHTTCAVLSETFPFGARASRPRVYGPLSQASTTGW